MLGLSRKRLFKGLCVVLGFLGISWLALEYFIPSPPSKITIATGSKGTSLEYFGQHYREKLERLGIDVELRETAGSVEDFKLLNDPKSGVDVSFVTRGLTDNSQGSALLSLGVILQTPIWIFYSSSEPLTGLSQLKGKRIAVGSEGSGVQDIAERILGKANIDSNTATLLPLGGIAAVNALNDGKVDVVFIISVPDAPAIKALLTNPRFRLMDFLTAEAFTRHFPDFVKLTLPKGMVEIDPPNPQNDVTLLGITAKVMIRADLHPAVSPSSGADVKRRTWRIGTFSPRRRISNERRLRISYVSSRRRLL